MRRLMSLPHFSELRSFTGAVSRGLALATVCALSSTAVLEEAWADVKLPSIFSDNMALQQGVPLKVWGWAEDGEEVTVTVGGQSAKTTAAGGKWKVELPPVEKFGPTTFKVAGKNTLEPKNVIIADVWVCSGQSNMEWPVARSNNAAEETAAAKYPSMRVFMVPKVAANEPKDDINARWIEVSPETIGGVTAVGYFFGRELHTTLDRPVGLINDSWGGTLCEAWTSAEPLAADADYAEILKRGEAANLDEKQKNGPNRPSVLYNGMIAPIVPYAIKGAIWYQGESNAGRAEQYRKLLPTMIADWRKQWGQGDFPFYVVQLANFLAKTEQPGESAWAELREAQWLTGLNVPHSGTAIIIDIGDEKDIHPQNKQDVGKRLAFLALKNTYGKEIPSQGPVYKSMSVDGNRVKLAFDHVHGGLIAKDGELKGFAVCGEDKKWVWAKATIEGETVVLEAAEVAQPIAVRYGWANNPDATLFNKAGIPAPPFRTDDFPGTTTGKK